MKIKIKDRGPIQQAEFELGDFTIICGGNNTGKTYVTYALFGFLQHWSTLLTASMQDKDVNILLNDGVVRINLSPFSHEFREMYRIGHTMDS